MRHIRSSRLAWPAGALLVAGAAAAQGFSCLDTCADRFGNDIVVGGKRYDLSSCSSIRHDDHTHVDNYTG